MEDDVLDILENLRYSGPLLTRKNLTKAISDGPKSIDYTVLVEWLSKELKVLCKLEDHVNAINTIDDANSFLLEVSSFLKELYCPHKSLTDGNISQRLQTTESRLLLLVFLGSELEASRMISHDQPDGSKKIEVAIEESSTANDLKTTLISLGFSKPPPNITSQQLFSKVETKVKERVSQMPPKLVSKPLFTGVLSDKQWNILAKLHQDMCQEYQLRREMLLKRLDVTIQSFQWSGKAKTKVDEIAAFYQPKRRQLFVGASVNVADLLAAREDLSILEKTSSSSVRKNTQCKINKVIIGRVPDRGGRPSEQQAPPPEMPSWQKRSEGPQGGRGGGGSGGGFGGRGGRGGDRGGRVQGNWAGGGRGGGGGGAYASDGGGYRDGRGGGGRGGGRGGGNQYQGNQYSNDQGSGYGNQRYGVQAAYDAAGSYSYNR